MTTFEDVMRHCQDVGAVHAWCEARPEWIRGVLLCLLVRNDTGEGGSLLKHAVFIEDPITCAT